MAAVRTIDTHAHILSDDTMALIAKESPKHAPVIQDKKADVTTLTVGSTPYHPFIKGGWNIEQRLKDMDNTLVDIQVLSATPQTYYYEEDASVGAALSAIQNEQIAKHVKDHPERFIGIATLPMQAPDKAAAELRRGIQELGLRGAMIGSNVGGKNLDDPTFENFWKTAEELDAFIFIHPVYVAAADRLKNYYLRNFIGNPLDTTIAAASLVFGGVLEKFPEPHGRSGAWRRLRALPDRPLDSRLARAQARAAGEAQEVARGIHRQAALRHDPSRQGAAGIARELGGRAARAARQRLSLRHGDDGPGAARPLAVDPADRQGHHPGHGSCRTAGAAAAPRQEVGGGALLRRRSCGAGLVQRSTGWRAARVSSRRRRGA